MAIDVILAIDVAIDVILDVGKSLMFVFLAMSDKYKCNFLYILFEFIFVL